MDWAAIRSNLECLTSGPAGVGWGGGLTAPVLSHRNNSPEFEVVPAFSYAPLP